MPPLEAGTRKRLRGREPRVAPWVFITPSLILFAVFAVSWVIAFALRVFN